MPKRCSKHIFQFPFLVIFCSCSRVRCRTAVVRKIYLCPRNIFIILLFLPEFYNHVHQFWERPRSLIFHSRDNNPVPGSNHFLIQVNFGFHWRHWYGMKKFISFPRFTLIINKIVYLFALFFSLMAVPIAFNEPPNS